MRKSNIFRVNRNNRDRLTFRAGWRRLSRARKIIAVLFLLIWIVFCIAASFSSERSYLLIFLLSGISLFISYVTQAPQVPESAAPNDSLLAALSVQDGQLFIAGEALPANVKKLVLGKDPDRGIAFMQLAWNNGDEWQFAIDEYPAVADYLTQYMPQLQVVYE